MKVFFKISSKDFSFGVAGLAPLLFFIISHMSFLEDSLKRVLFVFSLGVSSLFLFFFFHKSFFEKQELKKSSILLLLICLFIYFHSFFYPAEYEYGVDKISYIFVVMFLIFNIIYISFYNLATVKGFVTAIAFFSILFCFLSLFLNVDENNLRKSSIGLNPTIMSKACLLLAIYATSKILVQNKSNIFYIILILFSFVAIIKTGSRGAIFAYFFGLLVVYYFLHGFSKIFKILLILPVLLVFVYYSIGFLPEEIAARYSLEAMSVEENSDEGDRVQLWIVALGIIGSNFWGIGSGNFLNYSFVAVPHNFFLELAVEYGIIASTLVFFLLCYAVYNMKESVKKYYGFNNIFFSFLFASQIFNALLGGELSIQSLLLYVCMVYFVFGYYRKLV
ncbi:O-antigen ligase family protein [Acinetobacter baumannii]